MRQVVTYKVKPIKNTFILNCQPPNKAAYKKWSFTRSSNCKLLTGLTHVEVYSQTRSSVPVANELMNSFTEK